MTALKRFIQNPITGRPKRGSLARVGEYLGVSMGTVRKWYDGVWIPGEETKGKIDEMIASKIDLSSRNKGHSGRKIK